MLLLWFVKEECEQMCAQHLKNLRDFTKRELEAVMGAGLFNESEEVGSSRPVDAPPC